MSATVPVFGARQQLREDDHKDVTDYRSLGAPVLVPDGLLLPPLTAAECLAKAAEYDENTRGFLPGTDRRHCQSEAAGWRRRAAERAAT